MIDSRESQQTNRFRWFEKDGDYFVFDMHAAPSGDVRSLGDPGALFCNEDGEDCLMPGTQRFYDALNGYFENEQIDVALVYYEIVLVEMEVRSG